MKTFDFIRPPFWDCPKCGNKDVFGLLMVFENQYTRRCRTCRHTQSFKLPSLNVTVLYLDQNILSNMLRVLDPSTPDHKRKRMEKHLSFFTNAFKKLHRLSKLHLLVCPESSVHYDESVVSPPDFRKLKRLYELLSCGVSFISSNQVRDLQMLTSAARHCGNPISPTDEVQRSVIIRGNLNGWRDFFRLTLNGGIVDGLIEELRDTRDKKQNAFGEVWEGWRTSSGLEFEDWYREERVALSKVLKKKLSGFFERTIEIKLGLREITIDDVLLDDDESLVVKLGSVICGKGHGLAEFERVWKFLESDVLDEVPHVRISSLIFAALACRASLGQKLPKRHPFNDVDVISAYLPYCDAMFLDNEMESILSEKAVKAKLGFKTQVFSLRTKDKFMEYLESIEARAPAEHVAKVREVYGESWEEPFVEMFQAP